MALCMVRRQAWGGDINEQIVDQTENMSKLVITIDTDRDFIGNVFLNI